MIKKITAILLICTLCINLCGCSMLKQLFGLDIFEMFPFLQKLIPTFTVSFDMNYDDPSSTPDPQKVKFGKNGVMIIPYRDESHAFAGWYMDKWGLSYFDLTEKKIFRNYKLYARWVDISDPTDTDEDGLTDVLEEVFKTNINKPDTDNDSLSDYIETEITYTSPTKKDTDNNGVPDSDEDCDNDTLSNIEEVNNSTNPAVSDTDGDMLSDSDEINIHGTNPIEADTDGDGADDKTEIKYDKNALVADKSFIRVLETDEVDQNNPVSLKMSVKLAGEHLDSVFLNAVTHADNPHISTSIPGYIGHAFEFCSTDTVEEAVLEFTYDTALFSASDNFDPRIYSLNQQTGMFEELPNQVAAAGKVQGKGYLSPFKTYILLNKTEFEKVWEHEIKQPILDGQGNPTHIDAAFAIDVSNSMNSENRLETAKSALRAFVNALGEKDKAAIVQFNSSATTLCNLTQNKNQALGCIDNIVADDITSMYTGFELILNHLTNPNQNYGYKMAVILSDGMDVPETSYETHYRNLVNRAKNAEIAVYTIGVGNNIDTSTLSRIASETGGEYYHATSTTALVNVFKELQRETIDLTKDSNNDKIPDYFNDMLMCGTLRLSNASAEFVGIDFNYGPDEKTNSADYDGDGLLNGEELKVTVTNNRVNVYMVSNPLMPDTDSDGFNDKIEVDENMNPLIYSYPKSTIDYMLDSDIFLNHGLAEKYRNDIAYKVSCGIVNALSINWFPQKECQEVYMNYFNKSSAASVDSGIIKNGLYSLLINVNDAYETINNTILKNASQYNETFESTKECIDKIKSSESIKKLNQNRKALLDIKNNINLAEKSKDTSKLKSLAEKFAGVIKNSNSETPDISKLTVKFKNVNKYLDEDVIGKVSKGTIIVQSITTALDITQTTLDYATLLANYDAYIESMSIIAHVAKHGETNSIKNAAWSIYNIFDDEFMGFNDELNKSITTDVIKGGSGLGISALAASCFYVQAVTTAFTVLDLTLGIGDRSEATNKAIYLDNITDSAKSLFLDNVSASSISYESNSIDTTICTRYLTHIAQMRIDGEKNYIDYSKNRGLLKGLFADKHELNYEACNERIEHVKNNAQILNLTLAESFLKPVKD